MRGGVRGYVRSMTQEARSLRLTQSPLPTVARRATEKKKQNSYVPGAEGGVEYAPKLALPRTLHFLVQADDGHSILGARRPSILPPG